MRAGDRAPKREALLDGELAGGLVIRSRDELVDAAFLLEVTGYVRSPLERCPAVE